MTIVSHTGKFSKSYVTVSLLLFLLYICKSVFMLVKISAKARACAVKDKDYSVTFTSGNKQESLIRSLVYQKYNILIPVRHRLALKNQVLQKTSFPRFICLLFNFKLMNRSKDLRVFFYAICLGANTLSDISTI